MNIYSDRDCLEEIIQPIIMNKNNIHFYCSSTVRVDIKIVSEIYSNGYILIEDQLIVNHNDYFNTILTLNDSSIVVSNNGDILTEVI